MNKDVTDGTVTSQKGLLQMWSNHPLGLKSEQIKFKRSEVTVTFRKHPLGLEYELIRI